MFPLQRTAYCVVNFFLLDLFWCACFSSLSLTIPWGLLGLQLPLGSLVGPANPGPATSCCVTLTEWLNLSESLFPTL